MEIRIGIKHSPRELAFDSDASTEELRATIDAALSEDHGFLNLKDSKGREYLVNAEAIAFIEFGGDSGRKVGFVS